MMENLSRTFTVWIHRTDGRFEIALRSCPSKLPLAHFDPRAMSDVAVALSGGAAISQATGDPSVRYPS
jgi:hypothetical protein